MTPRLRPGQVVYAADRGNYGHVVRALPNGQEVLVHFKSPSGHQATVTLSVGKLTVLDGARRSDGKGRVEAPSVSGGIDGIIGAIDRMVEQEAVEAGPRSIEAVEGRGEPPAQPCGAPRSTDAPPAPAPEARKRPGRIQEARRRERGELAPCYACGGTRFWLSVHGRVVCKTCHPPASPDLVAVWIEVGGDGSDHGPRSLEGAS